MKDSNEKLALSKLEGQIESLKWALKMLSKAKDSKNEEKYQQNIINTISKIALFKLNQQFESLTIDEQLNILDNTEDSKIKKNIIDKRDLSRLEGQIESLVWTLNILVSNKNNENTQCINERVNVLENIRDREIKKGKENENKTKYKKIIFKILKLLRI